MVLRVASQTGSNFIIFICKACSSKAAQDLTYTRQESSNISVHKTGSISYINNYSVSVSEEECCYSQKFLCLFLCRCLCPGLFLCRFLPCLFLPSLLGLPPRKYSFWHTSRHLLYKQPGVLLHLRLPLIFLHVRSCSPPPPPPLVQVFVSLSKVHPGVLMHSRLLIISLHVLPCPPPLLLGEHVPVLFL